MTSGIANVRAGLIPERRYPSRVQLLADARASSLKWHEKLWVVVKGRAKAYVVEGSTTRQQTRIEARDRRRN